MIAYNMLWKIFVVVAFGLSATATSTEDGPLSKNEESVTKPQEVSKSETDEPPKFSVEWYLLPKPENRATLRYILPYGFEACIPEYCKKPILPAVENRIRNHFSWVEKQKQKESDSAQRKTTDVGQPSKKSFTTDPVDVPEPPKYSLEWYFVQKPENRKLLRDRLPYSTKAFVAPDCREPIAPVFEKRIRDYLSLYSVDWYLLPEPENRTALRYMLPEDLAAKVPENCNEPIDPELEELIREHFTVIEKKQRPNRFWYLHL
ncbi:SmORF protein [Babesia bovis T2Bo]|uniref:SmORF protein n=1 Tax=Babesia bovis T2Bo TaxID=484906 RepID=UPI001C34E44B|nr:SmORF protein [Babesia bovis T2Bo]EDO06370.2 SmORF protein [Babesia bovis T2Bo]